ncbi:MAG TPA: tRNA adenosine deaminase-associated protein [Corynebacteriales bacterium]|nr:tRNA adenosine deaminase-associated protein [Mycobacteriales bacterium]
MTNNYSEERSDDELDGAYGSYDSDYDDDSYDDSYDYDDYDDDDYDYDDDSTSRSGSRGDSDEDMPSYAIAVHRDDSGEWDLTELSGEAEEDFDAFEKELRKLRTEGPLFGILNRGCDYFVIARPGPNGMKMFVSDIDAATEEDLVIEALEEQGIDLDADDEWDDWAVGDYDILEDLGLTESILSVIVDDEDSWADEQIMEIAENLGFDDELSELV